MKLINYKNTIYLEFSSSSKTIKKSLKLAYTNKNLLYATNTLLPLFQKLHTIATITYPQPKQRPIKSLTSTTTLKSICYAVIVELKLHAKLTTVHSALYAYKRIFDFLIDKPIPSYTHSDIQLAIYKMHQNLSPKTIHLIISYLNLAFKKAITLKLITQNPVLNLKKPRIRKSHKTLFNPYQISTLLSHATGELQLFLYIAFYTGARSGEILALSKDDIQNSTIKISKNKTRFELTSPKNGSSRIIHAPKPLLNFLKQALPNIHTQHIFQSDYFQMYYKFKSLLKSLNFVPCGLHITRHCYATLLLSNKVSPIYIAKNLGHSNLNEINQTYSHYIFDKKDKISLEKALKF
ncbi:site-specific integrase [Campylobacter sp. FMV-PI01]|uniref:Site-specific integrase n=1 Tax=Campylobacter portucalensis TaxID=2608384 RepID=A0A6L5WLM0_9BACT|nr:site-specific integrase [Campylobacter portucalensis]MSN97177.1 site-specific integrase [Campylobacter portucalensis]